MIRWIGSEIFAIEPKYAKFLLDWHEYLPAYRWRKIITSFFADVGFDQIGVFWVFAANYLL